MSRTGPSVARLVALLGSSETCSHRKYVLNPPIKYHLGAMNIPRAHADEAVLPRRSLEKALQCLGTSALIWLPRGPIAKTLRSGLEKNSPLGWTSNRRQS
jgi:hypothetical protein